MSKKKKPTKKVLKEIQGRERQKLKEIRIPVSEAKDKEISPKNRNPKINELIQQNKDTARKGNFEISNVNRNQQDNAPHVTKENVEEITVKDFVVRSNIFHCMHEKHKAENIHAVVSVITKFGNYKQLSFTGGYCPNCNLYFIMEPDYLWLKENGTIACRVTNYKTYERMGLLSGDMKLADESLLMQYGYTVSQTDDLSSTQRRCILSMLIENEIMTKSQIVSYLNFFIRQRSGQKQYSTAIERWKSDIDYLTNAGRGGNKKVLVGSIKVRT